MDIIFKTESSIEIFESVSQDILNHLYTAESPSKIQIDSHVLIAAKQDIKNILSSCNYDIFKVAELLGSRDWNHEKVECFISLLKNKKTELIYAALSHHNSFYGETITEFDWCLKLILGSNDLKTMRYPLLQLILLTTDCREEQKKVTYDVSKDVLLKLINALEEVA